MAKYEVERLALTSSDFQIIYLTYEEKFYLLQSNYENEIKYYEDKNKTTINNYEEKVLQNLYDLLDKSCKWTEEKSDQGNNEGEEDDLKQYLEFDAILIKGIEDHVFYTDPRHKLYVHTVQFVNDWHKLAIEFDTQKSLYLVRLDAIEDNLQVSLEIVTKYSSKTVQSEVVQQNS